MSSLGSGSDLSPAIGALILEMPKAELHLHLEGSIPPELALHLAKRHQVALPGISGGIEGVRDAYRFRGFPGFIQLYVALSRCLVTEDDLESVVVEVARGLAVQGVRYAEITFTPMTHVARGVRASTVLEGLARGRQRAREEHDVRIAWVFDIVRKFSDQAMPTLELALAERGRGVVALGLAGPEGRAWPATPELRRAFDAARVEGLHRVPHAGEQAGAWSIVEALDHFHAERLGHGFRAVEDRALIDRLIEEKIALELCPRSNMILGLVDDLASHPLARLDEAGVRWSLASDDPALFGTSLVGEFRACAAEFGWGREDIHRVARAAVEQSFMEEHERAALLRAQEAVLAP